MTHDNQYHGKNDKPCHEVFEISDAEIPCERKDGHTKDHQADVRDIHGRVLTIQWRKARAKD